MQGFAGLWIYFHPLIAIFILGINIGAILSGLLMVAVAIAAFVPRAGFAYDPAMGARFLCVYILVFILTVVYEWVRITKERWVKNLNGKLETARKRAEDAAIAKSSFLANTSHEIRTPMNAILGMVELLLRKDISPDVYEYALSIKQAGSNLLSIINDILDFSKIDSGKMEIVSADYHFASLINDVVNIIRVRIAEKPILFMVNIDGKLPDKLTGDEVRVRQVFLNILSNAVKYTKEGFIALNVIGEILDPPQDTCVKGRILLTIKVTDTGVGIREEDINKLFGEFSQFDSHKNRSLEGTGLGLAISRNLCRLMGGDITVQSYYGVGSTFTALIPQEISGDTCLARVENPEAKPVLLYEKQPLYAGSLAQTFEDLHIRVNTLPGPEELSRELGEGTYAFAFVTSDIIERTLELIQKWGLNTVPVLLAELGEASPHKDIPVLTIPAYSISIANVLNGLKPTNYQKKTTVRFIAPEARILIVDDIVTNLNVAKGLMALYQMDIHTSTGGQQAISLVKRYHYDLVFMDHMMPEMDGIETTAAIRALGGAYGNIPIIALTANAVSGMREMFLEKGFNDYLAKPIETAKLDDILGRWVPREKRIQPDQPLCREVFSGESTLVIEGVDTVKGIVLTGGTERAYRKVLSSFYRDALERLPLLERTPDEKTLSGFTTGVHALKSAAATIGAAAVSKAAAELEAAGKTGDLETIGKGLKAFYQDLKNLAERIQRVLERDASEETSSAKTGQTQEALTPYRPQFTELKAALEKEDIETIDRILVEFENKPFDENTKERLAAISDAVLMFELKEAIKTVDCLLV
jgi:signal transduction histidine kinase/CheY-like chemotaxis protein